MRYSAITIDTNIVTINGYNLEGGLLARLYQFNGDTTRFIISDIVLREIIKHVVEQTKETRSKLDSIVSKYAFHCLLNADEISRIREISANSLEPRLAARQRITQFLKRTDALIIKCEEANVKDLMKLYFESKPPFELSGKKKNEFPDAVALLSLENWARKNNKKVLAISNDIGWKDYAEKSEWIDVEADMVQALQLLQEHAEAARKTISELVSFAVQGKRPDIVDVINDFLADQISSSIFYAEADAHYRVEAEFVEGEFEGFNFHDNGEHDYAIDIVEIEESKIVASIKLDTKAKFKTEFTFFMYDSVDKDEMVLGGCQAEIVKEFEQFLLVTFSGNFSELGGVKVEQVEAVDLIDTIDFGYVEIDYGEPDEWNVDEIESVTQSDNEVPF